MTYKDVYAEGYYQGLMETEYTYDNGKKNQPDVYKYKSTTTNGRNVTNVSVSGNTKIMKKYDNYVLDCKAKEKKPLPFDAWAKRKGIIAAAGLGAGILGAGTAAIAIKHHHKKKAMKESYSDGYYQALCEMDEDYWC